MTEVLSKKMRIIIKVGSNVLTRSDGKPDLDRIKSLVGQFADFKKAGNEIIIVSSGAVAAGRSIIKLEEKSNLVASRQVLASIGQVALMNIYAGLFAKKDLICSQVLLTKEDFRDRMHYLNIQNCFQSLLKSGVIPIVNENDVVAVTELMFTDNDELAGLVAAMLGADELVILTNVNGIYNGDPKNSASKVIEVVGEKERLEKFISTNRSDFGRGGMLTKSGTAKKTARLGIKVRIANGTTDHILSDIVNGTTVHTVFTPSKLKSSKKRWLAHSSDAKGGIVLNEGARERLLLAMASSILPIGVIEIIGDFLKGDVIGVFGPDKNQIGVGIASFGSEKAKSTIGHKGARPIIHYDYLYLNQ